MDRKEAINILAYNAINATGTLGALPPTARETKYLNEQIKALNMAIEALQEPERKWIPVTEKLPENGCGVLVTVNGKHNNITFVDALEIAEYDGDFGWIVEGYPQWTDPNVTAWQPLPEPFEGREEECL